MSELLSVSLLPAAPESSRTALCAHCQVRIGAELLQERGEGELLFCCSGCETVYHLLRDVGLDEYYDYRARTGGVGEPVRESSAQYSEFDAESFRALYCRDEGELRSAEFALSGLHCAACVWLVERLPRVVPEVREARVNFEKSTVRVLWDPRQISLSRVGRSLARLGYAPSAPRGLPQEQRRQKELRSLFVRIGVAGACAGNVMLMAFALYSSDGGAAAASTMDEGTRRFFEIGSLLLSLPALFAGGLFFRGAWAALRTRTPHMDLPIAIGILVAFAWGALGVIRGSGELYFDSITTLIFLLLIGRYLQRRHQLSAAEAAELLHSVTPAWATRVQDLDAETPALEQIAVESIAIGDVVQVQSGDVLPIDGVIERGRSALDMSLLSGESEPVEVQEGQQVQAGCLNRGGLLWVRAETQASDTRVAQLVHAVERSLSERTPLVSQADRLAGKFTLVILSLSLITAVVWSVLEPARALPHALSLLIVACPCALAMATPLSLSAAARRAARRKILFFRVQAMERLARSSEILFDKTGTLTEGRLTLARWDGDPLALEIARAAESISEHPVARALRQQGSSTARVELEELREELGHGITGKYDGESLWVGSTRFVRRHVSFGEEIERRLEEGPAGASPLLVAWGDRVRAIGWLEDRLRDGVGHSLRRLHESGHRLVLLSGDHPNVVSRVAEQLREETRIPELFSEVRGGQSPEEKLEFVVGRLGRSRTVVMVGDGVNDAGALARADVGIAVHGAAEASRLSADVFLADAGARDLVELMTGAARTLAVIRRGILFSLAYNVVGVSLAMTGLLNPLVAAVLMPLSSLTVVTNAYRSKTFAAREENP